MTVNVLDINAGNAGDDFLSYEHRCQSEVIRQMKGSKVLALALDPITEKNIGWFYVMSKYKHNVLCDIHLVISFVCSTQYKKGDS